MFAARCFALAAVGSLCVGTTAAAAPAQQPVYSPWVALAAFASPQSSQALCSAAAQTAAAQAAVNDQQKVQRCLLPIVDAAPGGVATSAPGATGGVLGAAAPGAMSPAVSVLPLFAGLAVLSALAAITLSDKDKGTAMLPVSP